MEAIVACDLVNEGYVPCACRDCMDIAIGVRGEALCSECEEAGCEAGEGECRRDDAQTMATKTLTYGTLPTREEFDAAFDALVDRCVRCRRQVKDCACRDTEISSRFAFGNDPRVGTRELTASELWAELESAQREWDSEAGGEGGSCEAAGQWCSDVLGVLGFEWV